MSSVPAATLDHAGIAALVPHRGPMCLLHRMLSWDAASIECIATNHRDAGHPLRTSSGLLASATVEYAAQAAALHGALHAQGAGGKATPGYLASARDVRLKTLCLHDLPPVPDTSGLDELRIVAVRQAGDAGRLLYAFSVHHADREIASGRLAVVLQEPTDREAR
ncbi:MAG: hydroxymyristoyl-ACP dehydratase [Caldimonas sp.]